MIAYLVQGGSLFSMDDDDQEVKIEGGELVIRLRLGDSQITLKLMEHELRKLAQLLAEKGAA